jgi:membrane protease subunit (stomatin/prohibitin family)
MNDLLDESWRQQYGLEVLDVAININASEESKAIIREVDSQIAKEKRRGEMYAENPQALMAAATAEAMTSAAKNEGGGAGAAMAFMGMNMAGMTGSTAMGAAQQMQPAAPATAAAPAGAKFCPNCGTPTNGSNFCSNCGQKLG